MDISIRRLANPSGFRNALILHSNIRVIQENNVFHVEIRQ